MGWSLDLEQWDLACYLHCCAILRSQASNGLRKTYLTVRKDQCHRWFLESWSCYMIWMPLTSDLWIVLGCLCSSFELSLPGEDFQVLVLDFELNFHNFASSWELWVYQWTKTAYGYQFCFASVPYSCCLIPSVSCLLTAVLPYQASMSTWIFFNFAELYHQSKHQPQKFHCYPCLAFYLESSNLQPQLMPAHFTQGIPGCVRQMVVHLQFIVVDQWTRSA